MYNSSEYKESEGFSKYESEYFVDEENISDEYYDENFDSDDYYDYSYSARIKRFHDPNSGLGYYDNYYTNAYFYDYDPYYYGSSI